MANQWESWADFLANAPPGSEYVGDDAISDSRVYVTFPPIRLQCNDECETETWFDSDSHINIANTSDTGFKRFAEYKCRLCKKDLRVIPLLGFPTTDDYGGKIYQVLKIGQYPQFGIHVPARLLRMIDNSDDVKTFKKGVNAESNNLGIGAFAYYRRVVENQKDRLLDKIIAIARRDSTPDVVNGLEQAKTQWSFKQSVKDIKDAIPESLKIAGQNPMVLLHNALSEGIHLLSDEECMSRAHDIRLILTALAQRIAELNSENAALSEAVGRLSNRKAATASQAKTA